MHLYVLFAVLLQHYAQSNVVAGEKVCMASPLRTFYQRRAWQPAWTDANLAALNRAIENAESHGLDRRKYHDEALATVKDAEARDVLASDAFLRLAANLSRGAVDPEFLRAAWCAEPKIDLAAVLQSALDNNNVEETIEKLAPADPRYQRLRQELRALRSGAWTQVPPDAEIRKGVRAPWVVDFQKHHGLTPDGVIGRDTLRELSVTRDQREAQVKANLERWRWMPRPLGDRYAIVNIAGFQLDVYEQGKNVITMKTVVGKLYHETPFFAAMISDVTINPWWNVPSSIANNELWPKQHRDPGYFAREHMLVTNDGRIRQRPGAWNSLGRIKFEMPNRFNVYLHDTPAKSLFGETVRAFSHGCIRIERPLDLAHYLIGEQATDTALLTEETRTIPISSPVPVYVLYWTAWPANDGDIEYHRDVYGNDARVIAALNAE